jgi:hypothetical protein
MGSNLRRRGGVYWFRRRVPDAFKARVERNEINRSLRTKCAKTARARARQAWLATEAMFREMTLNPSLAASQAKLLIDALLEEPLRASRTADDLVDDLVSLDGGGLGKLLFNRPAVGQIMSLPEAQRQHIATHMRLIAERVEAGIARLAQATALDRAGLAQYVAAQETARATEAEAALAKSRMAVEVAAEVNRRLTEIAAAARAAEPAPPATPEMLPEPARTPVAAPGRRGRAPLFSAVEVPFLTDKQRGLHGYSGQTTAQVRTTFRLWVELVGDKPVPDYTGADAGHFRELVLACPPLTARAAVYMPWTPFG